MNSDSKPIATRLEAWLFRFVAGERIAIHLAVVAAVLAVPGLFVGCSRGFFAGQRTPADRPGTKPPCYQCVVADPAGNARWTRADGRERHSALRLVS